MMCGPAAAEKIALDFYRELRREVTDGNPFLSPDEQDRLRSHYPVMGQPRRYPRELAETIYARRRAHPLQAIMETRNPVVLDAGCGFGSESFLFASLGARVMAVDMSAEQILIAARRKHYYENLLGRDLSIQFVHADLEELDLSGSELSLTWLASVLAAVRDQEAFLSRIHGATRSGGKVIVTDMNLWNPLFLFSEWRRRGRASSIHPGIGGKLCFRNMVLRRDRKGARALPLPDGGFFDDVQFFTPRSLSRLLQDTGFIPLRPSFSGVVPPWVHSSVSPVLERIVSETPLIKMAGYFYVVSGVKE